MTELAGLTALITGAAGGIGTAMAEAFAGTGARLALVDCEDASELAERLGSDHRALSVVRYFGTLDRFPDWRLWLTAG